MFKNQAVGRKNLVGIKMHEVRKSRGISLGEVGGGVVDLGVVFGLLGVVGCQRLCGGHFRSYLIRRRVCLRGYNIFLPGRRL